MQCKKCGFLMPDTERFCNNCGSPLHDIDSQNFNPMNQQNNMANPNNNFAGNNPMNNQAFPYNVMNNQPFPMNGNINPNMPNNYQQGMQPQPPVNQNNKESGKKSKLPIILAIVGAVVLVIIIAVVVIIIFASSSSNKMICESKEGNITITYDKDELTGYKANGIIYEFDNQKQIADRIGVDAYLKEFGAWFSSNTSGLCTINGKKVESDNTTDDNNNNSSTIPADTKVVGDNHYGYITIPSIWSNFVDVDGTTALQYSYAGVFIVSLEVIEKEGNYTAKDYAANFMYQMKNSDEGVTDINSATVKLGKNKEYTAYQVYMYYPDTAKYLIVYLFDAEDGKLHYIALEGPKGVSGKKLSDYLFIPESFSLTNN